MPSEERIVNVKPFVRLKQVGRARFSVGVRADTTLVHRAVLIQRLNKKRHTWRTFRVVRLTHFTANDDSYNSIGSFRARLPHGAIIRALVTKRQARPLMYGPATSRPIRV